MTSACARVIAITPNNVVRPLTWFHFQPVCHHFIRKHDWAQREAYLEIARREALGLPLIDPDYIPPEKMLLPTDEELAALGEEPEI